ncbi:glycolipid transfer protein 2 [Prunus yedoensis var. nudiflora]|uniref:Glycolipid transfer protein 2 n=1 Tax=Prunus yedoensis var. nudiflora TaxID=2094558 RepID=A0A315B6A9_PRUYE|nr:glycolipid transfer protein 2 [Prunus yedoensis var. nudiflora]
MKRKIMDQKKGSEIMRAIEELSVRSKLEVQHWSQLLNMVMLMILQVIVMLPLSITEAAHIPTRPFLSLCSLILQIKLDNNGCFRQDIHQNIRRLEVKHESDPSTYSNMVEILKMEATEGIARNVTSSSRAVVWLTRWIVPDNETFFSSLMAKDENYDNLKVEIETFLSLLVPYLEQIHSILVQYYSSST